MSRTIKFHNEKIKYHLEQKKQSKFNKMLTNQRHLFRNIKIYIIYKYLRKIFKISLK